MDNLETSANALESFAAQGGAEAAENVARAFELAGDRISGALSRAAQTGELSFNALAESIAQDLARLAVDQFITGPLEQLVGGIGGAVSGALGGALGGGLGAGSGAGSGGGGAKPSVTINMNVSGAGASSFTSSQGQMATKLAQAVQRGQSRI